MHLRNALMKVIIIDTHYDMITRTGLLMVINVQ